MAVNNIDKTFNEVSEYKLKNTSLLNMFNILEEDNNYFLNLFRSYTVYNDIKSDIVFYDTYEISNNDFWENISYDIYQTVYLWWIICLINDVINPFEEIDDGKNIKVLRYVYIPYLIREIKNLADL